MLVAANPIEGEKLYKWEWILAVPPAQLWPLVSDTQRVGKAIGFGPWHFKAEADEHGSAKRTGTVSGGGMTFEWVEHPYEWVAPREMGVLRSYTKGPFVAIRQTVTIEPHEKGSKLTHLLAAKSHGFIGNTIAALEIGRRTFTGLDKVYRGFESFVKGAQATSFPQEPIEIGEEADRLLQRTKQKLADMGFDATLLAKLDKAIRQASDRELMRLRPFAVAKHWDLDPFQVLRVFLHATKAGVLEMSWDLICPSCKGAADQTTELGRMKMEEHCASCNVKFDAHFDDSVEVTFRPSAAVRPIQNADFCVGGPGNTRHLLAQRRILAGQTIEFPIELPPGIYRIRGARKPGITEVEVKADGPAKLALVTGQFPEKATLGPKATIEVKNAATFEHTVVVEHLAWKEDVATGSVVTCMQDFRDLFSAQVFAPGVKVGISSISLLFTDLKSSTAMYEKVGDAVAFALVRDHFKLLFESVASEQGGLVKTIGDAVMASFPLPAFALRAALRMHEQIVAFNEHEKPAFPVRLKIGLHAGPCIAVNLNDRLDYFGTTVNMAARIQNESVGDDIVLLESLAQDPEIAKVLAAVPGKRDYFEAELKGLTGKFKLLRLWPQGVQSAALPRGRTSTRFKQTNLFGS